MRRGKIRRMVELAKPVICAGHGHCSTFWVGIWVTWVPPQPAPGMVQSSKITWQFVT